MKVLCCHNFYQHAGGEDLSFEAEAQLLEAHGHEVIRHTVHNDSITGRSKLRVAVETIWNRQSRSRVQQLLERERPDIMHCTNIFPLLSPSIYDAAFDAGVPVVQSLRNYRLLCLGAYLMRNGKACESCVGRSVPWPGILHKCYRGSLGASLTVAGKQVVHRWRGTYERRVDMFYALTTFAQRKYIEGGLPAEAIAVKPNFLATDPGIGDGSGGYLLFVGRLSEEKGLKTLLDACRRLPNRRLLIVGDGPLRPLAERADEQNDHIQYLGRRSQKDVLRTVKDAAVLVVPSLWYEGFPRTILEALASGTPAIVSRLGSMSEIIDDGVTGAHFTPGDVTDLAQTIERVLGSTHNLASMRKHARQEFEMNYTADINYEQMMRIYECARKRRRRHNTHSHPHQAALRAAGRGGQ